MVNMFASSVIYHGFEPQSGKKKTIQLVFVASRLSTQHRRERKEETVRFIRKIASVYIVIKTTIAMPKVCVNNIKCSLIKAMPLINIHFVY